MKPIDVTSYMRFALILENFVNEIINTPLDQSVSKTFFMVEHLEKLEGKSELTISKIPFENFSTLLNDFNKNYRFELSTPVGNIGSDGQLERQETMISPFLKNFQQTIDIGSLKIAAETFKNALYAELPTKPTYFITNKLSYKVEDLIDHGERIFFSEVAALLPKEAVNDIRLGTRCFAFELPTASAFHLVRATESLIKAYYKKITGNLPSPKQRDWGSYTRNLRKYNEKAKEKERKANEKILVLIDGIREHHRNPVIHPELNLDMNEAGEFIGIIQSVISVLIKEIKNNT